MISARYAGAVEIARSDESLVGNTAHEWVIEPLRFKAIARHK